MNNFLCVLSWRPKCLVYFLNLDKLGGCLGGFAHYSVKITIIAIIRGHLQTIYCVVGNFTKVDAVIYKRWDEEPGRVSS